MTKTFNEIVQLMDDTNTRLTMKCECNTQWFAFICNITKWLEKTLPNAAIDWDVVTGSKYRVLTIRFLVDGEQVVCRRWWDQHYTNPPDLEQTKEQVKKAVEDRYNTQILESSST